MNKKIELLAPGGDLDSIKAAIVAGADAVYCGLNKFNARNRAVNIELNDLNGILRLAHQNSCQIFIALNIIILESEMPDLIRLLDKLVNTSVDGVIIQDLGLFYLISKYYPSLNIHASTQVTTHNIGQIRFLKQLGGMRVNLSRELNLKEINRLTYRAHKLDIQTEVFVHGSYCISFSGLCYMSTINDGRSANRGRCSQPCRDQYKTTAIGSNFPLNLKDNCAYSDIDALAKVEVGSLKIEGRIKKFHYVYVAVKAYREQLIRFFADEPLNKENESLYKVFNRDFSKSYLNGKIDKTMFIENPRDNSAAYWVKQNEGIQDINIDIAEAKIYDEKTILRSEIKEQIDQLNILKAPLTLNISGECDHPLRIEVITPDKTFKLTTEQNLKDRGRVTIDQKMLAKRFKALNETEYNIENIIIDDLQKDLYISFKELTALKNRILFILKDSKPFYPPIERLPKIETEPKECKTTIAVLISSPKDLPLCQNSSADFYFQLPNWLGNEIDKYIELFKANSNIIPWIPAILIDKEYDSMVQILEQLQPKLIVTNNTGIAYKAYEMGIKWIAGPYLNLTNSYSLLALKENFNCNGAFISNEINQYQISCIKPPEDFDLYYSIYHPILLMKSRQCLFHQVDSCEKDRINTGCIGNCKKVAEITNLKNKTFYINKNRGEYNSIYNENNFLNTKIIRDLPNRFKRFLIDLREVKTATEILVDKSTIIELFQDQLANNDRSDSELRKQILNTTDNQYSRGL